MPHLSRVITPACDFAGRANELIKACICLDGFLNKYIIDFASRKSDELI